MHDTAHLVRHNRASPHCDCDGRCYLQLPSARPQQQWALLVLIGIKFPVSSSSSSYSYPITQCMCALRTSGYAIMGCSYIGCIKTPKKVSYSLHPYSDTDATPGAFKLSSVTDANYSTGVQSTLRLRSNGVRQVPEHARRRCRAWSVATSGYIIMAGCGAGAA